MGRTDPRRTLKVMGEPRWLDHDEEEAWLALVRLMFKLPAALDAQLLRDAGLNLFEYLVLSMLSMEANRTLGLSELATLVSGSPSRLSNVIKRLEKRGLVNREPDPANARYAHAVLTDAGYELVVGAAPGHVAAVRRFVIDGLNGDQVRALREVGYQVADNVDAPDRKA
ncbi:MarR family transcriptional regulator [Kineosporia sp. NBRC 101731]|nr:MarR family transcriptional regulator [Kineosporia sp. NBRC 101731]